jgi:predicted lipase
MNWSCDYCHFVPSFQPVTVFSNKLTGVYGFVGFTLDSREIVVSFRGSNNTANYIIDLDAIQIPYENYQNVTVHQGFYEGYKSVQAEIHATVDKIVAGPCPGCTSIICTGHSLGAAVSGFCALDFATNPRAGIVNTSMVNFGMPRVGNPGFAALWQSTSFGGGLSWRFVHNRDIVPHVPFQNMATDGFFHHVPTEIWDFANINGTYRVCDSSGEDPTCSDSLPTYEWLPSDHMNYMDVQNVGC